MSAPPPPPPNVTPAGAFLQVTETSDGQYTVKEFAVESALPKVVNDSDRKRN